MRQMTLFVFIILAPLVIYGQATSRWAGKNHYIKPKPKNKDFVGRRIYIAKVVDKRVQKKYLGTVEKNELIYMAKFEQPFEAAIQDIFIKMYPFKESYLPVTVFVHQFLVEEQKGKGITTVDLEFFQADTTESFLRIQQSLEVKGTKLVNKHRKVIVDLLSDCLKKADTKLNHLVLTNQIRPQDSFKLRLPLKKGIYNDYLGMVLQKVEPNVPITIVKFEEGKVGRFELKHLRQDRQKIKNAFAASDGKDLYINARLFYQNIYKMNGKKNILTPLITSYYLQAKLYGRYLYFEDKISNNIAGHTYGLLGTVMSMRKAGFVLDTKDGIIRLLDTEYLRYLTTYRPDIRKVYNASKKNLEDKKAIIKSLNEGAFE